MKLFLLSTLVAVALSKSLVEADDDLTQWELFKIEHEKEYETADEETKRRQIFLDSVKFVKEHNAKYEKGEVTFDVKINKFADMTTKEFKQMMNGLRIPPGYKRTGKEFVPKENLNMPKTVDWREKGYVTPVKDQGQCGSCWAFSAAGAIEALKMNGTGTLRSLSAQNLVDCSKAQGNDGCNGGLMDNAFEYVKKNKGMDSDTFYPYIAQDGPCQYKPKGKAATCTGFVDIESANEDAVQQAVYLIGPISAAMDASQDSFRHYNSGVYRDNNCSSQDLDHGVLVAGFGTSKKGGDYWLIKNSWSTKWGMGGYGLIARNEHNMCGIASMCSYPTN